MRQCPLGCRGFMPPTIWPPDVMSTPPPEDEMRGRQSMGSLCCGFFAFFIVIFCFGHHRRKQRRTRASPRQRPTQAPPSPTQAPLRRRRQRNLLNQISLLRWLNRHRRLTKKPLECLQSLPMTPNDHALNSYWANMSTERSDRKSPFMPRGPQQCCQRVVFIIIIRCTTVGQTTTRHNNKTFFLKLSAPSRTNLDLH